MTIGRMTEHVFALEEDSWVTNVYNMICYTVCKKKKKHQVWQICWAVHVLRHSKICNELIVCTVQSPSVNKMKLTT